MENNDKWYFSEDQLKSSPSCKDGILYEIELRNRKIACHYIRDLGCHIKSSLLCTNTAIVYMHRFYMMHSMLVFPLLFMSTVMLYVASKVEEERQDLNTCLRSFFFLVFKREYVDTSSEEYKNHVLEFLTFENVLLLSLGFEVEIEHPHNYILRFCYHKKVPESVATLSCIIANAKLCETTLCLQYKPSVLACLALRFASEKLSYNFENIDESPWWNQIDPTVTLNQMEYLRQKYEYATLVDEIANFSS